MGLLPGDFKSLTPNHHETPLTTYSVVRLGVGDRGHLKHIAEEVYHKHQSADDSADIAVDGQAQVDAM